MALDINPDLMAHIKAATTSLASCLRITRLDGQIFAFTDHNEDIIFDPEGGSNDVEFRSKAGFSGSSLNSREGLAVDNMEIQAVIDDDTITDDDLKRGLFSGATIEVFLVNFKDTSQFATLKKGTVGDIRVTDDAVYSAEVRGTLSKLQNRVGGVYLPTCSVRRLGDSRCNLNLSGWTDVITVTGVTDNRQFTFNNASLGGNLANPGHVTTVLQHGILEWLTGANAGTETEIKTHATDDLALHLPMPYAIAIGDTCRVTAGCNRTRTICTERFDNITNFRGYPDIPGVDELMKRGDL